MITQDYLKSLVVYDKETGIFVWKFRPRNLFKTHRSFIQWNNRYAGKQAGTLKNDSGYVVISIHKNLYRAHRLAWLYVNGVTPSSQIDHINGIRHDNRLSNLRDAQNGENHKNKRLLSTNKSGYHGIWRHPNGKYRAKVSKSNQQHHLGYFENINEAVEARKKFEAEYGYHPNHGLSA